LLLPACSVQTANLRAPKAKRSSTASATTASAILA